VGVELHTSPLLLLFCSNLHLFLVELEVGPHLLNSSIRDSQSEFLQGQSDAAVEQRTYLLSDSQVQPELSPSPEAGLEGQRWVKSMDRTNSVGEQLGHFLGRIAPARISFDEVRSVDSRGEGCLVRVHLVCRCRLAALVSERKRSDRWEI
jgi:hypothetical protein